MTKSVRVVLYGLGAIGTELARLCLEKKGIAIVGAIDIAQDKVGRDLGEIAKVGRQLGVRVSDDPESVLSHAGGDVVLHCTTSYLSQAEPQIAKALHAGYDVISTCEELSYPWRSNRHFALQIDQEAKRMEATVLGTGVNPGFVMDALVIALTSVCRSVRAIEAKRVVDVSKRRLPLQKKVGAGLTREEFEEGVKKGALGHVGTRESIDMIADAMGWDLQEVFVTIHPVVAKKAVKSEFLSVEKGRVAGIRQAGRAFMKDEEVITLNLEMYLGAPKPRDAILIDGVPRIEMALEGGIKGDDATIAAVVNAIRNVVAAEPGLRTMRDLILPSYVETFGEMMGPSRH